jgi:hypothetical protein
MLHAGRLKDFRLIKSQDRQALYLKARLGFRYNEIAALPGITSTAVNRRITEGRRRQLVAVAENRRIRPLLLDVTAGVIGLIAAVAVDVSRPASSTCRLLSSLPAPSCSSIATTASSPCSTSS